MLQLLQGWADRRRVLADFRRLAQIEGARWCLAVLKWHAVDLISELPVSAMRALLDGTHPFCAAHAAEVCAAHAAEAGSART